MENANGLEDGTSEISQDGQDAFVVWLLSRGDPRYQSEDRELNACAVKLIQKLINKHHPQDPIEISRVEVEERYEDIDAFCLVNQKYAIIVEDKIKRKEYPDHLEYYREMIETDSSEISLIPIYFRAGEQSNYKRIEEAGYKVLSRREFLEILDLYQGDNSTLKSYRKHLRSLDETVNNYKNVPLAEWNSDSWKGFYVELQRHLSIVGWNRVTTPESEFMGCWWHWQKDPEWDQHLQIQEEELHFKIKAKRGEECRKLRNHWSKILRENAKEFDLELKKPKKFGSGKTLATCLFKGEYRAIDEKGVLDIERTVATLKRCEKLLTSTCEDV